MKFTSQHFPFVADEVIVWCPSSKKHFLSCFVGMLRFLHSVVCEIVHWIILQACGEILFHYTTMRVCVLIWCLNKWFFPGGGGSWQYITVETMGLLLSLSPGTSRLPTHARPSGICGPAVGPNESMLSDTRACTGALCSPITSSLLTPPFYCTYSILCSSALLPFSCWTTASPFSSADFSPPDVRQSLWANWLMVKCQKLG